MGHIHHRILESGLSHPETVLVLYGFCIILGIAALILALKTNQYSGIILFVLTAIILVGFKKFGMLDITRLWGTHDQKNKNNKKTKK
jgi:UDP-GlcNAc:undecaprenyl-phosphate GlcNAc-1-phosphate transferase